MNRKLGQEAALTPGKGRDGDPVPALQDHGVGGHAERQIRREQGEPVLAGEEGEGQVLQVPHDTGSVLRFRAAGG